MDFVVAAIAQSFAPLSPLAMIHSPPLTTSPQQLSFCDPCALDEKPPAPHRPSGGSTASASLSEESLAPVGGELNDWRHQVLKLRSHIINRLAASAPPLQFGFTDCQNQIFKSKYFCEHTDTEELVNYSRVERLGLDTQSVVNGLADWSSPTVQFDETNGALIQDEGKASQPLYAQDSLLNLVSADVLFTESGDPLQVQASGLEAKFLNESKDTTEENDQKQKVQEYFETSNPQKQKKCKKLIQPKYALETRTETVEVLDDGYKWRKYGQKPIKNSPHPRSYYRCRNSTCSVKKQVERSAQDSGIVVTTYHGMHNHYSTCESDESQVEQLIRSSFSQLLPLSEASNHLHEQLHRDGVWNSIIQPPPLVHNLSSLG